MSVFLAVDGGNSKTEVLVGDTSGHVVGFARGGGTNHQTSGGLSAVMGKLTQLVRGVGDGRRPDLAVVCLAGADLPVEVAALTAAVETADWADKSIVDNDMAALLRAGTEAADAVAVVCGAGINCLGRAADGRMVRFPALGHVSGDWGGGQHLGALALWHAARAEDGRGPATALVAAVAGHFDRTTAAEVSAAVHLGEISPRRLGELSPVLFRVSAAGDEVARSVVTRQADEIVALATAALRRLDLLAAPTTVVLGGGVLRALDPLLFQLVSTGLHTEAPRAQIALVTDPPVVGAALLAMDTLGADKAAQEAMRAQVRRLIAAPQPGEI
ncbi:BadF-type ATPase [Actinokineospora alba]|uniref:BadF-type ATPase n=1 Tax=Actinokineospora alba TaxID=504798 RepID=A0A1H0VPX7_9PSEU|nr:BadF/BadG/BcrA/BcrD ATPase family protein [Actinokineospora alba]TDP70196.1 N-acetylglucosamine kinase-like BadF-type ATPase [Actinokineospora alba]SDI37021.1 BadF-type ATPase [Actinokineospora alba]SDP80235.1 BadF-type ATPase [Actinokineospora alba]